MSELLDFLVWMWKKHKKGEIPIQQIQVTGMYAFEFFKEQEENEVSEK